MIKCYELLYLFIINTSSKMIINKHFELHLKTAVFTLMICLNLTLSATAQDYWTEINSPTDAFLHALFFTDSLSGWVGGDSGQVFFTTDGGANWVQQQTNTDSKIEDIFFIDENQGWAIGWNEETPPIGTEILKTTDGGLNWSVENFRENNVFLASIYFLDSLNGWSGGFPGKLIYTTDGGTVWADAKIDSGGFSHFPVIGYKFFNSQYGFACGGAIDIAGVVWKTTNGGATWAATGVSPEPTRDLHFFDSLNVLGVGGDPEFFGASIVRTTDAGDTWVHTELGFFGVATSLAFRTPTEGWAPLSFTQTIIYSTDSGESWIQIPTPGNSAIYEIDFTDSLTGYGVGFGGKIIKYKKPIITATPEINELPESFVLYQNFPNPFNPVTKISWLAQSGWQTLKIFDALGNQLMVLIDEYRPAGKYEIEFDASEFNSGVYFYSLENNGKVQSKKMILLK